MRRRRVQPARQLLVDPVSCDAVGLCAQLARGLVELDRWGYPIVPARLLTSGEAAVAKGAVRGCPRRALALVAAATSPSD
jgi:ferredoxin